MISIIVPTMWKFAPFADFASNLLKMNLVGELIIINNDRNNTPNHKFLLDPKVKVFDFGKNIFVNPAWNLGVSLSKQDKLCIMNDDLEFDVKIFDLLKNEVNSNCGMIGVDIEDKSSNMRVEVIQEMSFGYACLFFINKQSYIPIPNNIKIFYGDNWLFNINKSLNKNNKKVFGISPRGFISATSKNFMAHSYSDKDFYELEYKKFLGTI